VNDSQSKGRPPQGAPGGVVGRVRVLAVDDEPMNLELLERSLRRKYCVLAAPSPQRALEILRSESDVAVILSDYRMPGMTGAELLAHTVESHPYAKRVVITGYADSDNVIAAVNDGHIHYLIKKPWNHHELHQVLEQLVHGYELERENRQLLADLHRSNDSLRANERTLVRNLDEQGRDLLGANRELERVSRELDVRSYKDTLTGLYNHGAFRERLREERAHALRYGQPLSLLYGDIDRFAEINKELGYQIGDEVLRRVAEVITAAGSESRVRESDIVARYSGEEFVVLLPETTKQGAVVKADRLRLAVARAELPGGLAASISFGVAAFPEDATSCAELIGRAEAALAAAKRGGRNRVHLYSGDGVAVDAAALPLPGEPTPDPSTLDRFRTYHERLSEVISILKRDRAVTCLLIDLSRLRRIELDFGVAQHAEVYAHTGELLDAMRGQQLRRNDVICRTDDDDAYLCILAPARTSDDQRPFDLEAISARVAEHLNIALAPVVRDLIRDQPRITVGFARVLNNSMVRPERLIARLINEAKESARLARQRMALRDKASLQEIILGDGLMPVYQPIVHIESADIFGYEALTRGPRGTPLESPATLFSIADEVDLTFELDRACFRGALRGAVGLEPVHRLFVNLLPLSFYDSSFIETEVSHLLEAAALTPANLVFEITERLAIENFASFRRALATYTAMGFGVAIDDVGTRHSNLETVMALRPHFIKVSDVLTRGVSRSTVKREMLRSLGRIAEAIDAAIVAEGIETADDLVVLHDLGIRYGQGFFLARPGPPFPRLRASVRRAVQTLADSPRAPIPALPVELDYYDEEGDVRDSTNPGLEITQTVFAMAHGSGKFSLPSDEADEHTPPPGAAPPGPHDEPLDDFAEQTRPRPGPDTGGWRPLSLEELGAEPGEGVPLIDSLRGRAAGPPSPDDAPADKGKILN
jgi:diguanylate cyclase (GGDEF)-like protein